MSASHLIHFSTVSFSASSARSCAARVRLSLASRSRRWITPQWARGAGGLFGRRRDEEDFGGRFNRRGRLFSLTAVTAVFRWRHEPGGDGFPWSLRSLSLPWPGGGTPPARSAAGRDSHVRDPRSSRSRPGPFVRARIHPGRRCGCGSHRRPHGRRSCRRRCGRCGPSGPWFQ